MKTLLLTLFGICLLTQLHAQQSEFSLQASGGLFHYSGTSAAFSSYIIQNGTASKDNYTNDPYGHKDAFSYGVSVQEQYIAKSGFILGVQAGYEILKSKVDITQVRPFLYFDDAPGAAAYPYTPSAGQTFLQDRSINFNPYLGYRLKMKAVKLDLMPGVNLGINLSSYDKGKAITATNPSATYTTDLKLAKAPTDVQLKLGAAAYYNKFGVTVSYGHGLTNYTILPLSNATEVTKAHSEQFNFGLSYRIL
jgi:hypothetical protein